MNGCWRTENEIKTNTCNCDKYDKSRGICLSELDTVSSETGYPVCPKNPKAITRTKWMEQELKKNEPDTTIEDALERIEKELYNTDQSYYDDDDDLDCYFPYGGGC